MQLTHSRSYALRAQAPLAPNSKFGANLLISNLLLWHFGCLVTLFLSDLTEIVKKLIEKCFISAMVKDTASISICGGTNTTLLWIGGRQHSTNSIFSWSDEQNFDYTNWDAGSFRTAQLSNFETV